VQSYANLSVTLFVKPIKYFFWFLDSVTVIGDGENMVLGFDMDKAVRGVVFAGVPEKVVDKFC